jgi:hypothetical protein
MRVDHGEADEENVQTVINANADITIVCSVLTATAGDTNGAGETGLVVVLANPSGGDGIYVFHSARQEYLSWLEKPLDIAAASHTTFACRSTTRQTLRF